MLTLHVRQSQSRIITAAFSIGFFSSSSCSSKIFYPSNLYYTSISTLLVLHLRFLNARNFNNKPKFDYPFFSENLPQLQRSNPLQWKQNDLIITEKLKPTQDYYNHPKQNCFETFEDEVEFNDLLDSIISSLDSFIEVGDLYQAFKAFTLLQLHIHTHGSFSSSIGSSSSYSVLILQPISRLLLSCSTLRSVQQGKQLHAHIFNLGLEQNPVLLPKLVTFYSNLGYLIDAHIITESSNGFYSLPWNVLISAYVKNGFCGEAIDAYKQMRKMGIKPNKFTYPSVLKACGDEFDLGFGKEVHRAIDASGLELDLFVQNALVAMYAKCGDIESALELFDKMPEKDFVSWNSIISGYGSKGMWSEALEFFEMMRPCNEQINLVGCNIIAGGFLQTGNYEGALALILWIRKHGIHLDSVAMVIGLGACSRIGLVKLGTGIHGYALRSGLDGNESVRNTLITMYSRCYAHLDRYEEASFMLREMISAGVQPNNVTIACILPLCARVGNLQHGKVLHCYIVKLGGLKDYLLLCNSLVDMYSKSGEISVAQKLFDSMNEKDGVTYTSLIDGYGMQGKGEFALKLFKEMESSKIKPDHITMVAVLSACSHSGLVGEGEYLFYKMSSLYGVNPRLEHYSCMVDLFGRAGLLRVAVDFIKRMPFRPSAAMWITLIVACRKQGNKEIGEWAARELLQMSPENREKFG